MRADSANLEADVLEYLQLAEQIEHLTAQQNQVKARLRSLEPGKYLVGAVSVSVSPPPRSFNVDRAWSMLSEEQRPLCVSPDAKKIRSQLPPTLVETCMDPGTGEARVTIK